MAGFELVSVVHLVRPTGARARNLEGLRAGIAAAAPDCLFYHACQYVLRFHDADELPPNDFAAWVEGVVQDRETAERLAFAAAQESHHLAGLRRALLAVLEAIPENTRLTRDAPEEGEFRFHGVDSVVVPAGLAPGTVDELVEHLRGAEPASLFYHLYERPLLHPEAEDTLEGWVEQQGERALAQWLRDCPRWGLSLEDARRRLVRRWNRSQLRRRLAARAQAPESERRRAGKQAVSRLMDRWRAAGEGESAP